MQRRSKRLAVFVLRCSGDRYKMLLSKVCDGDEDVVEGKSRHEVNRKIKEMLKRESVSRSVV